MAKVVSHRQATQGAAMRHDRGCVKLLPNKLRTDGPDLSYPFCTIGSAAAVANPRTRTEGQLRRDAQTDGQERQEYEQHRQRTPYQVTNHGSHPPAAICQHPRLPSLPPLLSIPSPTDGARSDIRKGCPPTRRRSAPSAEWRREFICSSRRAKDFGLVF